MKLNKLPLNVIGLNRVGLNQIGSPSHRADTSARPYIDPEVLASLVAVCICDGKSNNDPDRAVIKNLVDPDNPFIISNAAFKLNSGYGKYEEDFTTWRKYQNVVVTKDKITVTDKFNQDWLIYKYSKSSNGISPMRIKITGIPINARIEYRYAKTSSDTTLSSFDILEDGIYDIPESFIINNEYSVGFKLSAGDWTHIEITQIPSHQGALVTDGKDDMITSTKTVQEMLGGSNEVTVVSMVHQIGLSSLTTINNIRSESVAHVVCRNICSSAGKTGVYGYSRQINTNNPPTLINNILGDKKDYTAEGNSALDPTDKFFVQGYKYSGTISEVSPIAYYWTFIANKVLTTDQINQVISYFNLDKHVKPDVYYDVKKQGLSNDTPEADWYLKDFSGNGHDMQLYNFAKKLGSGISKYEEDFTTWRISKTGIVSTINVNSIHVTRIGASIGENLAFCENRTTTNKKFNIKLKISGLTSDMKCTLNNQNSIIKELVNGVNEISVDLVIGWYGFTIIKLDGSIIGDCDITIEQIPDYEGALVFDAVDDYGQFVGDLGLEDYTIAVDRAYVEAKPSQVSIMSNVVDGSTNTPFLMEHMGINKILAPHSFGKYTALSELNINRFISYQSTYKYNRNNLDRGTSTNTGSGLTIGRIGGVASQYANIALWSLLLFPYTLSEFLLERQLKRYKLGTLYPGMIEWRPKVNINVPVVTPPTFSMNNGSDIITNGQYIPEGTEITIRIFTTTDSSVGGLNEATAKINGVDIELSPSGNKTYYGGKFIVSSKQKIDITIDEYIRYEDIVQPYPAIINLKQDGKTITWGDKLKVGSDIVFAGSANLLPELYTVSETRYNGVTLYPNTIIKVEKSMVFDNARIYLKANEPNCILSPNRLRIPNSSYKILRYIPDLTGKGNHGVINNSAYIGMSGANGYKYDWNTYTSHIAGVKPTDNAFKVNLTAETSTIALFGTPIFAVGSKSHYFRFKISGLINNQKIQIDYPKGSGDTVITSDRFGNGEYSTKDYIVGEVKRLNFYVINAVKGEPINVSIEQLPEYEGSFCFDGTDDHITIPTLSHGGKCMLIKVNWNKDALMLYDQRMDNNPNSFAIYIPNFNNNEDSIAYSSRNDGKTYIDGVLNTSVKGSQLKDITHNITITNSNSNNDNTVSPVIGSNAKHNAFYAQMALFDFMLFSEIPNEDEIKELNEVMGIENNIEVS